MSPLLSLLLGIFLSTSSSYAEDCCEVRVVSNMGDLDDVYKLKEDLGSEQKPEDICFDGCIYTRANESHAGEEYCFKNENIGGFLECQAIQEDATAEDLTNQKSSIEAENEQLEQEVQEQQQQLAVTEELTGKLDDVDAKIENITSPSGGRQVRQAPSSCDEIADLVTELDEAENANDRLSLVVRILASTVTKCTTSDKLLKVKIKIKTVKTKNDEEKIKIKIKIKSKKDKIEKNKIKITVLASQLEIFLRPTKTPKPEEPTTPIPEFTTESPISITTSEEPEGEEPIPIVPGGEEPIPMVPGGEEPIPMVPGGETPVPIWPEGGETPVPIWPEGGETPVPIEPTGETPTPIWPGGETPTPIWPGGETPTPIWPGGETPTPIWPGGETPVVITPTGEVPVPITIEEGEEPVAMGEREEPVAMGEREEPVAMGEQPVTTTPQP